MKKTLLLTSTILFGLAGAAPCLATMDDVGNEIKSTLTVWGGGYFEDLDRSTNNSLPEDLGLAESATRVGGSKAAEYYSLDNSISGGFLYQAVPLPNRFHLEADYFNENEWFGDFRYAFKDLFQLRLLPRRFSHNLDNLTVYDFDGAGNASAEIDINDAGIDDYNLRVDIDKYRLRLKTPNFPLHFYSDGEIIKRKGKQQMRFLGGRAYFFGGASGGRVRVAESRDIDQENKEFSFGTNAHLGPVEFDFSHRSSVFDNDVTNPTYAYETFGPSVTSVHNVIPRTETKTNTLKLHSSHTGRIYASATFSETDKSNEYSGAQADRYLSYGELTWLPSDKMALAAKLRHQKNKASAPTSVTATNNNGALAAFAVNPGVNSTKDDATLELRYTLTPKTNLKAKYQKSIKDIENQSADDWERPLKTTKDMFEIGATCRALPKVRATAKLNYTNTRTEFNETNTVNNDPEDATRGNLGLTWTATPRITAYLNADILKEDTGDNRQTGGLTDAVTGEFPKNGEALRQQYVASVNFMATEKLSISPSYSFMSYKQDRDMAFEDGAGNAYIDSNYDNEQTAHNFALNVMFSPNQKLNLNGSIDYTIADGSYNPTDSKLIGATLIDLRELSQFAETQSQELNLRFNGDYDLGNGWGAGLELRYTDWSDDSFDNPSDSSFVGGLIKITKKLTL